MDQKQQGRRWKRPGKWWYDDNTTPPTQFILSLTTSIALHLSIPFRKPFILLIDSLGLLFSRLVNIYASFFLPIYHIQGKEPSTDTSIYIKYKGNLSSISYYLSTIMDKKTVQISSDKKQVKKQNINNEEKQIILNIYQRDAFFLGYHQRRRHLILPEHISMILDVRPTLSQLQKQFSNSILQDLKKAHHMGYHSAITSDLQAMIDFFHTMYLPFIKWRHHGKERYATLDTIKHIALQGGKLLLVTYQDKPVFGGMFLVKDDRIITYYAGLSEGSFHHLQNGIMALSYVLLITHAKEIGCTHIDFGTARPFLNDGLYQYKRKWGMDTAKPSSFFSDIFALSIQSPIYTLMPLIQHHPWFVLTASKIISVDEHIKNLDDPSSDDQ